MRLSRDADTPGADENDDYYSAVEKHFVALRGSPLFVSPREWELIHRWRLEQIPLRVVKQGLDQAFDKRKPNRPIRRLSYCRQTVEANYRRFREAIAGVREGEDRSGKEPADVQAYLGRLQRELVQSRKKLDVSRASLGAAIDRAARSLAELASEPVDPAGVDDLERQLDALEASLIEASESALRPEERQRCLDEAERSLGDYRTRMPLEVFRSALRGAYLKRVRGFFDLPALSLFYL